MLAGSCVVCALGSARTPQAPRAVVVGVAHLRGPAVREGTPGLTGSSGDGSSGAATAKPTKVEPGLWRGHALLEFVFTIASVGRSGAARLPRWEVWGQAWRRAHARQCC